MSISDNHRCLLTIVFGSLLTLYVLQKQTNSKTKNPQLLCDRRSQTAHNQAAWLSFFLNSDRRGSRIDSGFTCSGVQARGVSVLARFRADFVVKPNLKPSLMLDHSWLPEWFKPEVRTRTCTCTCTLTLSLLKASQERKGFSLRYKGLDFCLCLEVLWLLISLTAVDVLSVSWHGFKLGVFSPLKAQQRQTHFKNASHFSISLALELRSFLF